MSAASFQSFPTFSQMTTYFPMISCGAAPLVFRLTVPISRAAVGPSDFTSSVVTFGSPTCSEFSDLGILAVLHDCDKRQALTGAESDINHNSADHRRDN